MIRFTDRASVGRVKDTKEGYLIATARVARTGNQNYLASELGDVAIAAGFKPDDVVRVYRAPDQVFSDKTLTSITRVPVTLGHPPEMVDADNWSKYAVGEVGDAYGTEPEWIVVNPMIKDASAREKARTTHPEISMGYTANIVKARDGVDADFEMVDIDMNHLALVQAARAGSQARIGDAQRWGAAPVKVEDADMTIEVKTVVLGDKAVQVVASDADTVAAILKEHKTAIDANDAKIGELEIKLADAQDKVLTDDALAKLVADKVAADAKRKAVVDRLGEDKVKDMTDAQIEGAFLALDAIPEGADDSARDALKDHKPGRDSDYEKRIKDAQAKFLNLENK